MRRWGWGVVCIISGCAVGPDYQIPCMTVADKWLNQGDVKLKESCPLSEKDLAWWEHFHDPDLTWLIHEAVRANLSIRIALANIRESRSIVTLSIANFFPNTSGTGSYTRRHFSQNVTTNQLPTAAAAGGGAGALTGATGANVSPTINLFQLGFDATWELDIFGGLRRAEEAAFATLESVIEDSRGILLTQIAEVAQNYLSLRDNQQQLAILMEERDLWEQYVRLKRDLFRAGLTSEIDVNAALVSLSQTQAQIPIIETNIKTLLHQLALLLGKEPGYLYNRLGHLKLIQMPVFADVTISTLPLTLLQQRPDIRQAERSLAAATANVGVSIATMFPLVNLLGNYGVSSNQVSLLFKGKSQAWSYSPTVSLPLIDFGRIQAQVETQEALQDQSLLLYKQTILAALGDVETSFVALREEDLRSKSLYTAWQANLSTARLMGDRYHAGLNAETDVIQAKINALLVQQDYVKSVTARGVDLIALYKALGGGWDVFPAFQNQDHSGDFVLSSLASYAVEKVLYE